MRRAGVEHARDGDRMSAATDVELRHDGGGDWRGFFVALPVYRRDLPHTTIEDRRRNLLGILGGTLQTAAVIDSIIAAAKLPQDVDLYLYAAGAGRDAGPAYTRISPEHSEPVEVKSQAQLAEMTHWSAPLKAGDASWKLVVVPTQGGPISFYRAWLVLAAVILMFAAVLAYMWASFRHALRLETANSRILQLAQTDLLTNLANRRAFLKRLTTAFTASLRGAPPFAVLYLDIDNFKDVNDTLGHAMGDLLLKEVVNRLRNAVRPEDLVARFGGDEFAILLLEVTDPAAAGDLAARIGKLLAAPFSIKGHKVRITSSIGIALYSSDLAGPEAMMMQADLALYGAKDEGRNCYRFHSRDLDLEVHERVRVADELRVAVEQGELELYYQPQVELSTGRIIGIEALIRWNHKTRGLLAPASFIPIAERTGAILPLGQWVFEQACRQLKLWQDEGIAPQVLSINVSSVQFKGASELDREIEASLTRWGVNPSGLELELTESVLMEATQRHSNTLENLRQLGTKIAIDDFGTGYSSLKYLTQYPGQSVEARAGIRVPRHRRLSQRRRGQGRHPTRQRTRSRGHRRRGRDRGASALPDGRRLRAGARFLFQPPGDGARSHGIAARGADRTESRSLAPARPVGGLNARRAGHRKSAIGIAQRIEPAAVPLGWTRSALAPYAVDRLALRGRRRRGQVLI